jgi:hypothetical protein
MAAAYKPDMLEDLRAHFSKHNLLTDGDVSNAYKTHGTGIPPKNRYFALRHDIADPHMKRPRALIIN